MKTTVSRPIEGHGGPLRPLEANLGPLRLIERQWFSLRQFSSQAFQTKRESDTHAWPGTPEQPQIKASTKSMVAQ